MILKMNWVLILVVGIKVANSQLFFATTQNPFGNQFNFQNGFQNNFNFPPFNIPVSSTGSTCICVTTGYCNRVNGSFFVTTETSSLIDIRIVNSGIYIPSTSGAATFPASTGVIIVATPQSSCQFGLELCCINTGYMCGIRFPPVQGSPAAVTGQAPYGSYPWFALILQQSSNSYVASGVLIDQRHVLTVAHKVVAYSSSPFSLKVRLGEWTIGGSKPINSQEFNVIRVFPHFAYNSQTLSNSIAILRLNPDVPLGSTPTITTACLSTNQLVNRRCWVAGYGQSTPAATISIQNIMQHVEVPLVDQFTCQNRLRTTRLGSGFSLDLQSFLCAGGVTGRDACTGDGGAGLMCHQNGQWYVAGLVAWGIGCGTPTIPGVYMNVTNYISWIQSTTNQQ